MSNPGIEVIPHGLPLDWNELVSRCLGKRDWAGRIVGKFQTQLDQDLAGLKEAIAMNRLEQVVQLSHRLKGACANASAPLLRDRAADLEAAAKSQAAELIHETWQMLCTERDRFYDATLPLRTGTLN